MIMEMDPRRINQYNKNCKVYRRIYTYLQF